MVTMTLAEAVEYANRIDVSGFPLGLSVRAVDAGAGMMQIDVTLSLPLKYGRGSMSGADGTLNLTFDNSLGMGAIPWNEAMVLAWVRTCLIHAVTHELDEHITIDGRRPFDPHR